MNLHDLDLTINPSRLGIKVTKIRTLTAGIDVAGEQRFQERRELGHLGRRQHGIDHQHAIALEHCLLTLTNRCRGAFQLCHLLHLSGVRTVTCGMIRTRRHRFSIGQASAWV